MKACVLDLFLVNCKKKKALFICWDTLLSVWFFGGSSTLAMSLYCAAGRFGDLLVTGVLPNLGDRQTKMMVSLGCVVLSLCSNIALTLVDRKQRHLLPQAANVGPNVQTSFWSQIRSFPRGYWLCVGVSVILYGLVGTANREEEKESFIIGLFAFFCKVNNCNLFRRLASHLLLSFFPPLIVAFAFFF